jgi:hypothetical protein
MSASFYLNFTENNCENIIRADGLGYYSYLPAIFIYNDYQFSFTTNVSEKNPQVNFGGGFLNETNKGKVNKYYVGLSILCLPFFLIAHFLAIIFSLQADGYSQIYQLFILIASNFYLWVGCYFTKKLLLQYIEKKVVVFWILGTLVFGTNLFFYSSYDPAYTHMYSFAMISMFLFYSHSYFKTKKKKHLYILGILLGIITLLRPTNVIIVLMFLFFAKNIKELGQTFIKNKMEIIFTFLLFIITLLPQFILYYLQTGSLIVWSYGEERFYFNNPQFFNVLFSYKKGVFIYTPLILLSCLGLFYLFKKNKYQFIILLAFLFVGTYIVSSWWCWWYGASLGQRAFVDYYSVLALMMAFTYLIIQNNFVKILFSIVTLFCIYYSQIIYYQYRNFIIDSSEMNMQKFWFTFLKTDKSLTGLVNINAFFIENQKINIVTIKTSKNTYLSSNRSELGDITTNKSEALAWESFNMIELNDSKIALKSDDGNYLSTRLDNDNLLTHTANEIKEWETFEIIPLQDDIVIIKACNNKFFASKGNNIHALAENENDAEHFIIVKK